MTVAALLLGAALLLLPGVRPQAGNGRAVRPTGRSPLVGPVLAGGLSAAAMIAGLGPRSGLPAALVVAPATVAVLVRLRRRPVRGRPDPSLPLVLDLVAAVLRAGRPLSDAVMQAAPAADPATAESLERVAALLGLGADPEQAWSVVARDGPLAGLAAVAVRSASSGIRLAGAFERLAGELRSERLAWAAARANRAGVLALAPLAACFLPSFVCLGVVPVVVGLARGALPAMP